MGQVCQKCGDGDLICTKSKNGPGKVPSRNKITQRLPGGAVSLPNSDMTFNASSDKFGESTEQVPQNTLYTQIEDNNLSNFDAGMLSNLMASQSTISAQELHAMENQQRNVLSTMKKLKKYDERSGLNPIREHYDKLIKLKLKTYVKQGCPQLDDIKHLQTQCMHQYRTKNLRDQSNNRRGGLFAQGDKKLITDYAFYQEIIIKFHFIKQAQDDISKEIECFGKEKIDSNVIEADLLDKNYKPDGENKNDTEVDKLQQSTVDTFNNKQLTSESKNVTEIEQADPAEKRYFNTLNTEIEEKRDTSNGIKMPYEGITRDKLKEATRAGTVRN